MFFVWPAQRYERLTSAAMLVAAALTTCAGLAIFIPTVRIFRAAENTSGRTADERVDTVTFVQPSAVRLSAGRRTSVARSTATPASPAPSPSLIDTSSFVMNRVEPGAPVEPSTKPLASDSKTGPRALGPHSASVAATLARIDSGAAPPLPWR